jgi:hypothetical protein
MLGWLAGLSCLEELTLSGSLDEDVMYELSGWPGLAALRRLDVRANHVHSPYRRGRMRDLLLGSPHRNPATQITTTGLG